MAYSRSLYGILLLCLLAAGCGKSATQQVPANTTPEDPEEAALKIVANVYQARTMFKKKAPEGWNDLEVQADQTSSKTRKKVLDAINRLRSLNYKVTWGVDFARMVKEEKKPDSYVICESPDGRLKVTFTAKIIKVEDEPEPAEEQKTESDSESKEPDNTP